MQGTPAIGKRVEVSGTGIDRIFGGKIAESWEHYDALGILEQLGVISSREEQAQD
jgi:predicted ester cyclase